MKPTTLTQNDVLSNYTVRANLAVWTELRAGVDDGGGMNHFDCGLRIADCGLLRERAVVDEITTKARISFAACIKLASWASLILLDSLVDQHERHLGFAHRFIRDVTNPFGFADLSARLGQFHIDDQTVTRQHRFAPADIVR